MSINSELKNLYQTYWSELKKQSGSSEKVKALNNGELIANPMLLCVDENQYSNAKVKVMIFGQETWGWTPLGESIDVTIQSYKKFYLENSGRKHRGFWCAFQKTKDFINRHVGDTVYIWNNISKIGKNGARKTSKGVTNEMRKFEREHFPVVRAELDILKPDIVLFFTGPDRDNDIKFHFSDAIFAKTNTDSPERQLAKISATHLPDACFRIYHPAYFGGFNRNYENLKESLIQHWAD